MTTILVKRGTTEKIAAYTGECGELVFDTDAKNLYVMDGETVGGIQVGSNDSSGDIDGGVLDEPEVVGQFVFNTYYSNVFTTGYEYYPIASADDVSTPLSGPYTTTTENNVIEVPDNAIGIYCEIYGGSELITDNCTYGDVLGAASESYRHHRIVYITDRSKIATLNMYGSGREHTGGGSI